MLMALKFNKPPENISPEQLFGRVLVKVSTVISQALIQSHLTCMLYSLHMHFDKHYLLLFIIIYFLVQYC
jgi:hypothetical protein